MVYLHFFDGIICINIHFFNGIIDFLYYHYRFVKMTFLEKGHLRVRSAYVDPS